MERLWCALRGVHLEPVRQPIGGFRCGSCGYAGADLGDMGHQGGGYVSTLRKIFSRRNGGELTRTDAHEPTQRGF